MALGSSGSEKGLFRHDNDESPELSPFITYIAKPRPFFSSVAWLIGALAVSGLLTYLRGLLGLATSGVPLVFYFPAIIAVTLVSGWEFGLAALLGSVIVVWYIFIPRAFAFDPLSHSQMVTLTLWSVMSVPIVVVAAFLRAALQHLIRSEGRYRKLVDVLSDIVWVTDARGHILKPKPAWSRLTGAKWPEYAKLGWLASIHEDDRALLKPAKGLDHHNAEFRLWDAAAGDWRWYRSSAVALTGPDGRIAEWITTMSDVHEPKLARERSEIITGEARHRLKNLVTIIEALAKSSRQPGDETNPQVDGYLRRFLGRLRALGTAADLVLAGKHVSVDTETLIYATLAPFMEEGRDRFRIEGPQLTLSEQTGGALAMAMHELATNAIKYGALSSAQGKVAISWSITPSDDEEDVVFIWKEEGGPTTIEPANEGYGSRVIKSVTARERGGSVQIEYPSDGLYCRIAFRRSRGAGIAIQTASDGL